MSDAHQEPAPDAVIDALLQEADIPLEHGTRAQDEAAAFMLASGVDDPALADLESIPFVTVDNEDSRDLDQALHVATCDETRVGGWPGGWRIRYALADASHYVQPGSALWAGAVERGASLYAPTRAISMLPIVLSEELVSLNPGVARRALVFDLQVAPDGSITRCDVLRARVRSRLQLSYDGVQRVADGTATLDQARAPQPRSLAAPLDADTRQAILASLLALAGVGEALESAQRLRGVMPFDRTESEIHVTGAPAQFDVAPRDRLDSERWNEQLSLACNMQGAVLLEALAADDPALCPIFRVHDAPGISRLHALEKTLQALSDRLSLDVPWRRTRKPDTTLAEWFGALPDGTPRLKRAIQRQILRAQSASNYQSVAEPHHALAADGYTRFSSPMREIVGIHTHLVLLDAIGVQRTPSTALSARDATLRDAVIESADDSRSRQKALDRGILFAVIASLFDADLERSGRVPWRDGTLLGIDSHKLHVGLDGMALDVKVYREDLIASTGIEWSLDSVAATPADDRFDSLILGDGVRLRAVRYDEQRARYVLELRPLGNRPSPGSSLATKRRGALKRRSKRRLRRRVTR